MADEDPSPMEDPLDFVCEYRRVSVNARMNMIRLNERLIFDSRAATASPQRLLPAASSESRYCLNLDQKRLSYQAIDHQ
jgi:hypothetical protein